MVCNQEEAYGLSHRANIYVKHLRIAPNGEKVTPSEKAVLGQVADDHREEVGAAWSSMGSIAERACMSARNCRRIMRELERKGVIETTPNLQERNGAQTSNECRFCEIDPPFNMKNVTITAKRMELQKVRRLRMPVQERLYPPDNVVRGGRTTSSGAAGQRKPRGADNDVRGGRTTSSALDPLVEPSIDSGGETLVDPKKPTLPSQGRVTDRVVEVGRDARWDDFILLLKSEMFSIPGNLAAAKGFSEIKPGQNDFDTCFREWWLDAIGTRPQGLLAGGAVLYTMAEDADATEAGITKYRDRLVRIAKKCFQLGTDQPVTFKVLRNLNAAPALMLTSPDVPLDVKSNAWTAVKAELEQRLMRLPKTESEHALKNFREGIEPVDLVSIEMDGAEPVWKLAAINAKKTRATLGFLRLYVLAAIRTTTGGVVQLLVMDRTP